MKQVTQSTSNFLSNYYAAFLAIIGSLSTLLISPFLNFDPINMVKLCALVIGAMTVLPVVAQKTFRGFKEDSRLNRVVIAVTLFLIALFFLNLIVNSDNLYQTAWGVFGRNNGFDGYLSSCDESVSLGSEPSATYFSNVRQYSFDLRANSNLGFGSF
jgi:hypothetical protein